MVAVAAAHARLADDADAWIDGHGWDRDRWGRWPTAADLERVAPGRRVILWAHDHHALLASHAALVTGGVTSDTADPPGGIIRRTPDGSPEGVLHEAAARLVTVHQPPDEPAVLEAGIEQVGRDLVALGVVACHDPGALAPDPDLTFSLPAYTRLAERGDLPLRVHASIRDDGLPTAVARGIRSGALLGDDPDGWARIGWLKLFADGSMGSRTAALLADIEPEPESPLPPEPASRRVDDRAGGPRRPRRTGGRGRDRDADPRDRRRRRAGRARRPGSDRSRRPAAAPDRARPAARPGRPGALRRTRHRRQRAAVPCRLGRRDRASPVGRPRRGQRLHLGVHRADRRRHGVRHGCPRRADRPVAGCRDGRPARGPALAGRDARRSAPRRPSRSSARSAPSAWTRHSPRARPIADDSDPGIAPTSSCCRPVPSTTRSSRAGRSPRPARRWS